MKDVISLEISDIAPKVRAGEISPVDLVEASLTRISRTNSELNAFIEVAAAQARQAAKKAEEEIKSGHYRGMLHGIPIGIKDLIDTEGMKTAYGSSIYRDHVPKKDATVVTRLKEAGAVILGKTNLHEFALGITNENVHFGPTKNPWAPDRIPGGSSGGSAAAVAAYMCYGAIGTDTGGSIRIPSAFCGLVGLKPTFGRVSCAGVFPLAASLDHVGPMARSASDAAIILQAIAGYDEDDPRSLDAPIPNFSEHIGGTIDKTKIAVVPNLIPEYLDPGMESAYKNAIRIIQNLGGKILEKRLKTSQSIDSTSTTILLAEAATQHAELLETRGKEYGANVIDRFRAGQKITTAQYVRAMRENEKIRREIEIVFREVEYLLMPTVQILPPKIGERKIKSDKGEIDVVSGCVRFTRLANITGLPAIVIPFGYSTEGLPLSIQVVAPRLHESELLGFAHALEVATPELRNRNPMT